MLNRVLFLFVLLIGTAHAAYFPSTTITNLPAALGQQNMAGSTSVAIASDQSPLGIDFKTILGAAPSATNPLPFRLTDGTAFYDARQIRALTSSDQITIANTTLAVTQSGAWSVGINAGTNVIGKVSIDQTTPGTTNGVQVNAALPAGANVIGKFGIDQTTPGTTNRVQSNLDQIGGSGLTLGSKVSSASIPVVIASDQVAAKTYANSSAAFSQTSVTTTASTISAPANAVRVLIQGDSSNTDCIRYRFDGTAATSTVGMVAQPGQDSGQLDTGMSVSVASCSGTQTVNVQYFAQ